MTARVIPLPVSYREYRISVIMVSYHTGAPLFESLRAVLRDPDVLEVILIDNGNSSAARRRIWEFARARSNFRLVQGQGNIGFARACNLGAALAKGEHFLFLNPDAVIAPGTPGKLAKAGTELNSPWIVGGMLEDIHGTEQRGGRRDALTPKSALASFLPFLKMFGLQSVHKEREQLPALPSPMPVVSGACMMLDRESFESLGGFDEQYFLHVEDIDICREAARRGGDVYYVPGAKVLHYGATSSARVQSVEYQKYRGFLRYFGKYADKWWQKILLQMARPFIYLALMSRAWYLALRKGVFGE